MKATLMVFGLIFAVMLSALPRGAFAAEQGNGEKTAALREVHDFIKACGCYFLATVEGDRPRVRPFGTLAIFEGRLYFQTGKKKDVFKQMTTNPNIEICAYDNKGSWIRVRGSVAVDDRQEAKQFLLDAHPELKGRYSADDENTQVLYFTQGEAVFYSFAGETKRVQF
jgi:uncharacterized pyridoxamine 5'-phosphate oxidase family protein